MAGIFSTFIQGRSQVCHTPLSYYLQRYMNKMLSNIYQNDGVGQHRRWSFSHVIERLKAIRSQTAQIGDISLPEVISIPDKEQKMLSEALSLKL